MHSKKLHEIFGHIKTGFLNGLGWSMGVTVGIALVSTIVINLIQIGGGLPVVGHFFASIVAATQQALVSRQ